MSEQCEENPILARARTAIENGEAVNRVSALVARIEELEAATARVRGIAEAALAAHDELDGTYATVSAKAILNALEGGSDD